MSRSITHVLESITDKTKPLRLASLFSLSSLNHAELLEFQSAWADISVQRRRDLVKALAELAETHVEYDFTTIFRWNLNDIDPEVRVTAVDGLWEDEDPALIGPLVRLLETDEDERVRAASAQALGRFVLLGELEEIESAPAMRAEQALLVTLSTPEESIQVRRRAVESIAYSSETGVRDIIESAYSDFDDQMRISAIFAMGRSADSRWRSIVMAELANPSNEMRYEAARACGELELSEAVPHLIQMINDEDTEIAQVAIWSLGRIGGRDAQLALRQCADSEDEAISEAADEALSELELFAGMDLGIDAEDEDIDWDLPDDDDEDEDEERAWDGEW